MFYQKILQEQSFYFETKGDEVKAPERLGAGISKIVKNKKCIHTILGEEKFIPKVTVTIENVDSKYYMGIRVYDNVSGQQVKFIQIRSQVNKDLKMKEFYDKIIAIFDKNESTALNDVAKTLIDDEVDFLDIG